MKKKKVLFSFLTAFLITLGVTSGNVFAAVKVKQDPKWFEFLQKVEKFEKDHEGEISILESENVDLLSEDDDVSEVESYAVGANGSKLVPPPPEGVRIPEKAGGVNIPLPPGVPLPPKPKAATSAGKNNRSTNNSDAPQKSMEEQLAEAKSKLKKADQTEESQSKEPSLLEQLIAQKGNLKKVNEIKVETKEPMPVKENQGDDRTFLQRALSNAIANRRRNLMENEDTDTDEEDDW